MDETRKDLADKLEQLEKKVTGTVASVTDLVEKVPETVETVKETIQETVSTVSGTVHNTVEAVKDTVADTVESVKSFCDIPYQVDRHPWLMLGGSVLLGYLGGRLLLPRRSAAEDGLSLARSTPEPAFTPSFEPSYPPSSPAAQTYESARAPEVSREAGPAGETWVSRLSQRFGGEINKVKELAIGTLLGVARDMITRWAPENLRQDVTELVNNFTRDLGGKVIEGPVLGQGKQAPQGAEESHQQPQEPAASAPRATMAHKAGPSRR